MKESGTSKMSIWRPVFWWLLLVLVLFAIRTHQRWMEKTILQFNISLQGQHLYNPEVTFDGKPASSGQHISLGTHTFVVTHPKGETFSTNIFIWYGGHDFGNIDLKRTMGTLSVGTDVAADWLIIRGPEWSVTLTNSSGLTQSVPTDDYEIEADYPHWKKTQSTTVASGQIASVKIAPHFGTLQVGCNQPEATFQLRTMDGNYVSNGSLPVSVGGLPAANYEITVTHHGHEHTLSLEVKADSLTSTQMDFEYGAIVLETVPVSASVIARNGQSWGQTPITLVELLPGTWTFSLQQYGYQSREISVDVEANQTNFVSTNLLSETYLHAVNEARNFLTAGDYDHAQLSAVAALAAKPDDIEAGSLQRKAAGLGHLQQAKALGKSGGYFEGGQELRLALSMLPDNAEVKELITDFKQHEPEEVERLRVERLNKPKKSFASLTALIAGADLFDTHELKTGKPARETYTALEKEITSGQPPFQIFQSRMEGEVFIIEATQEVPSGLRRCVIGGGQITDSETQIYFKVVESKKVGFFNQPIGALMGQMPSKYTVIDPSQPQLSDKIKIQIAEGISNVTARIQMVILH